MRRCNRSCSDTCGSPSARQGKAEGTATATLPRRLVRAIPSYGGTRPGPWLVPPYARILVPPEGYGCPSREPGGFLMPTEREKGYPLKAGHYVPQWVQALEA